MLKCEIGEGITSKIKVDGTVLTLTNDVLNLIIALYGDFKERSPEEGEIFRLLLMKALKEKAWDAVIERA